MDEGPILGAVIDCEGELPDVRGHLRLLLLLLLDGMRPLLAAGRLNA